MRFVTKSQFYCRSLEEKRYRKMNEERKGMVNQIMADSAELIQAERRKGGILSEQSALEILKIEAIRELINAVEGVY